MPDATVSDFRSDTITRPTPAMYEAMATASLGDDVFGDDPTVNALQDYAAQLFGKEAALYLPSGTMANQVAARVHTRRGDEVIIESKAHSYYHEQAGLAALSSLQTRTLDGERGVIDLDDIRAAIRLNDVHFPVTSLLILENTHNYSGGSVLPFEYLESAFDLTREQGLKLHVDGARIANAEAASGISLGRWAGCADSISCCLSKGLSAPVGSLLMGDAEFIAEARRVRKLFGGAMRQAGVIAAAGLVALRDMRARLVDDHRRTMEIAENLGDRPGVEVVPPHTNLLYLGLPGQARRVAAELGEQGVLTLAMSDDLLRIVTHKDVGDADVSRLLDAKVSFEA